MIYSYIQEQHWNLLENFTETEYKRNGDPLFVFWKAYAQYQLGNVNGAINDLLSIQQKK